jgi:putative membrane protein
MYASALMAFLHHAAAFTLVGSLAVEVALFKPPLSLIQAQRLLRTDMIFGASATLLLAVGLLRVAYFEKGPAYYWHDVFFLIKFGAFILAALISIYPTVTFFSWNRRLKTGVAAQIDAGRTQRVRMCLMLELTAVLVILLCAALMARGFGYLGH